MEIESRLLPCGVHIVGVPPTPSHLPPPPKVKTVTHTLSHLALYAAFTGS